MEWKSKAKNLPLGQKTRSNCECGDGNTLVINHNTKYFSCHCFRCGLQEFEDKGTQTLAEIAEMNKLNERARNTKLKLELPHDYTEDIPLLGRLWLYKAGIGERLWKKYRIGYSEHLKRVILPVYDRAGKLQWYQCRAVHKSQKPKYIQPSYGRETVLFSSQRISTQTKERVVIVEDILSAIRVGEVSPTISILGTKLTTSQANTITTYKSVDIWLDPDSAGIKGAASIKRTLGLTSEARIIRSQQDPKMLTDQQIEEALCQL